MPIYFNETEISSIAIGDVPVPVARIRSLLEPGAFASVSAAPPQGPSAPQNLAATAGDAQVELTWIAPTTLGDGGEIIAYDVEYSTDGVVWTAPPLQGPSAPQNLAATAGDAQVELTWIAPATLGDGGEIIAYDVEYSTDGSWGDAGGWNIVAPVFEQELLTGMPAGGPQDLFFSPDGTKLYVVEGGYGVSEYSLGVAWDVSSVIYVQEYSVAAQALAPACVFFSPDGEKMYVLNSTPTGALNPRGVYEYSLGMAWDISSATYVQSFSDENLHTQPDGGVVGLFFKPDGTKMYVLLAGNQMVVEYSLGTAWSISTAAYGQQFSVGAEAPSAQGLFFSQDGLSLYLIAGGYPEDNVTEYSLSTAWSVASASYVRSADIQQSATCRSEGTAPCFLSAAGLYFDPSGQKLFVAGNNPPKVYQYALAAPT